MSDIADFEQLIATIPTQRDALREMREVLLANLALISEIPAPTFGERRRCQLVQERLTEFGASESAIDDVDNVEALFPGSDDTRTILVVAHADTAFDDDVDHTVTVQTERVIGAAIEDNSLGLAALVSLPLLLERLEIRLKANLLLIAGTRSLGRGNLEGIRFFLRNTKMKIESGVCVEGVQLGRLSYSSIGMIRGEISVNVPAEYDWTRFGAGGAIMTLNEVVNRLLEIPLPTRPRTSIVLGYINAGGPGFQISTAARLLFEARSESGAMVRKMLHDIGEICREVSATSGGEVVLTILSRRRPGGISFTHPLTERSRRIMHSLGINARMYPSTSELSALIDNHIPAITIGISTGDNLSEEDASVEIEPMFTGLAQLIGVLQAIDGGYCAER